MHEIAPDVYQLAGFPRDMFNVYMMEDVLVDAGTRWAKSRIFRQIHKNPPRLVALTHCHPDHQGAVRAVCEKYRIPLACHKDDAPFMEGARRMAPNHWIIRLGEKVWAGLPKKVDVVLRDGDEVAGFRVVHAPGHTPGHIMFFRESDRVVIAGDVLANVHFITGEAGLREPPRFLSVDVLENRRSIQKLIELRPSHVCFGHGPPLRDVEQLDKLLGLP